MHQLVPYYRIYLEYWALIYPSDLYDPHGSKSLFTILNILNTCKYVFTLHVHTRTYIKHTYIYTYCIMKLQVFSNFDQFFV